MSLETTTIGQNNLNISQNNLNHKHIQADPVHKGLMEILNKTVSPAKARPSFKSVSDVLSNCHLKEGDVLGSGHFGSVRKLTSEEEKATYVLKTPVKPDTPLKMNELNGARANNPHVTKTLAAIVENTQTHQIELHQPTSMLIEKPGAYTLQGAVYEYVPGQDLFEFIAEKSLTSDEVYDYASQMAEGIVAFQAVNGFHGDVKLENYMRHENGIVKLTDFGESKILEKGQKISPKQEDHTSGTPGYMAPEVCWGYDHDHTADAWSLGATLVDFVCRDSPINLFAPHSVKLRFETTTGELIPSEVIDQFTEFSTPKLNGNAFENLETYQQKNLVKQWLTHTGIESKKLDEVHAILTGSPTPVQIVILTEEFSQLHSDKREELIREWVIEEGFNDEELDEFIRVTNELLCYKPTDRIGIDEAFSRLKAKNSPKQGEPKQQLLHESTEMTEEFETGELEEISAIPQIEIELEATPDSTVDQAEVVTTVTPDTRLAETRKLESPKSSTTQRSDLKVSNAQDSDKAENNLQLPVNKYAPGQDLFTLGDNLKENLSSDEIYDIVTQATGSIAEFNARGSIYGNVHPQNFISNQQGVFELKLSGAGTVVSSSGWRGGMGTQGFQAPEVCLGLGNGYTQKADAWSHGATMLTFLLGGDSPDYLFARHSSFSSERKKEIEEGSTLTLTETMKLTEEFSKKKVSERKELIRTWVKEAELDAEELDVLIDVISKLLCFDPDERMGTSMALATLSKKRDNRYKPEQQKLSKPSLPEGTEKAKSDDGEATPKKKSRSTNAELTVMAYGYPTMNKSWWDSKKPALLPVSDVKSDVKDYPASVLLKKGNIGPSLTEVFRMDDL